MKYIPLALLMGSISLLLTRKKTIECGYHIISDYNGKVTFALTDGEEILDIMVTDDYWEETV
jgi:hypothetical protein